MGDVLNMKDEVEVKIEIELSNVSNLGNEYHEEFIKEEHKTVQKCAECESACHCVDELKTHQIKGQGQGGQRKILKCQKCDCAFHSKMKIDYHCDLKKTVVKQASNVYETCGECDWVDDTLEGLRKHTQSEGHTTKYDYDYYRAVLDRVIKRARKRN